MNIWIFDGVVSLAEVSKAIPPDITVYSAAGQRLKKAVIWKFPMYMEIPESGIIVYCPI